MACGSTGWTFCKFGLTRVTAEGQTRAIELPWRTHTSVRHIAECVIYRKSRVRLNYAGRERSRRPAIDDGLMEVLSVKQRYKR